MLRDELELVHGSEKTQEFFSVIRETHYILRHSSGPFATKTGVNEINRSLENPSFYSIVDTSTKSLKFYDILTTVTGRVGGGVCITVVE